MATATGERIGFWTGPRKKIAAVAGSVAALGAAFATVQTLSRSPSSPETASNQPVATASPNPGGENPGAVAGGNTTEAPKSSTTEAPAPTTEAVEFQWPVTETRFNSIEDIQATTDFLEPIELVIKAGSPQTEAQAMAIAEQWAWNQTVAINLSYGLEQYFDHMYYQPNDAAAWPRMQTWRDQAAEIGQFRVIGDEYGQRLDYTQDSTWGEFTDFQRVSNAAFTFEGTLLTGLTGAPESDKRADIGTFAMVQTDVILEDGSTHEGWVLAKISQLDDFNS